MNNILHKAVPSDAPENTHPIGSQAWADWIVRSRASTDYVVIIFADASIWPVVRPFPFLTEFRRQIDRGEAYWLSIADAVGISMHEPQPCLPRLPEGAEEKLRDAIQGIQKVLDQSKAPAT